MIETGHTAALGPDKLRAARALLYAVFDDMSESDWEHSLGGLHALAWEDGELVGHAALIQRRLLHGGRALRAGYVEGVAVRADARRRGVGGGLMAPLEAAIRAAYEIGALGAADEGVPFYRARGWRAWQGPLSALTPEGIVATPGEAVFVFGDLDRTGSLTCDWRDGDVW